MEQGSQGPHFTAHLLKGGRSCWSQRRDVGPRWRPGWYVWPVTPQNKNWSETWLNIPDGGTWMSRCSHIMADIKIYKRKFPVTRWPILVGKIIKLMHAWPASTCHTCHHDTLRLATLRCGTQTEEHATNGWRSHGRCPTAQWPHMATLVQPKSATEGAFEHRTCVVAGSNEQTCG